MSLHQPWCDSCGTDPAKLLLPDSKRRLCGVCAHRLGVQRDLVQRIRIMRLKEAMLVLEESK